MSGLLASLLAIPSLSSGAEDLGLVPLAPDHRGLTMRKYPSLCWMLMRKLPDGARMMFILTNSQSNKPALEVELPKSILTDEHEVRH